MSIESKVRLRDRREPGHLWADNEIYDVFGDELGAVGIGVYMTMARLCYGTSVSASLRSLAEHTRMSKDSVARGIAALVRVGLVIETKAGKSRAVSTYSLADAKALAREYIRKSVSQADSNPMSNSELSVSSGEEKPASTLAAELRANCLPVRQMLTSDEIVDFETDLSQKVAKLSQNGVVLNKTKDTRQVPPQPPQGGQAAETPDPDGLQRGLFEACNRFRKTHGRKPLEWEDWVAEEKASGAWPDPQKPLDKPAGGVIQRFRNVRPSRNSRASIGIFRGS